MTENDSARAYRLVHPRMDYVVVELLGEADIAQRDERTRLLHDLIATHDVVVVDVSETEFIDSTVIANLMGAARFARAEGKRFRLQVGTATIVRKALEISGILDALEWAHTREDALR